MPKSTAIATIEPQLTPATIKGDAAKGLEHFSSEDLVIPYMLIMQKLSPQLDGSDLKEGQLVNSITLTPYDQPILFIPLQLTKQRRYWKERSDGGGMICGSVNTGAGLVPDVGSLISKQCISCPENVWSDGKPPHCTFYRTFPSLVCGKDIDNMDKLIAVSFPETNKFTGGAGKTLANMARMAGGDLFSRIYTLKSVEKQNSQGQKFYALAIEKPSKIHEDDYSQALEYFNMLNTMNVIFDEETVKNDTTDADETPF